MSCRNVPAILLCWGNPGWGRTLETRVQLSKHQESRTGHGSNSALKAVLYLLKAPCFRNKFLRNCCLLYSYNPGCSARHGALCAFVLVVSDSLQPHRLQPARPLCPWDSPGKKAGAGCHFLLRGGRPNPGIKSEPLLHPGRWVLSPPSQVSQGSDYEAAAQQPAGHRCHPHPGTLGNTDFKAKTGTFSCKFQSDTGKKKTIIFFLTSKFLFYLFIYFFYLWWILSYIEMKQPWVYMCSPSRSPLPPPSPPAPSMSSQCTRSKRLSHASNLVICFTLDNIHVSMLFSGNIPPSPSPTESKRLFYKSVSFFFLFCI